MKQLEIRQLSSAVGLGFVERPERSQEPVETAATVETTPADAGSFPSPVDRAVAFTTDRLVCEAGPVRVHDDDGQFVATAADGDFSVAPGAYLLSLSDPIETYLSVEATEGVDVSTDAEGRTTIDFGEDHHVELGVGSAHERPQATITTTSDPTDVMAAVSALGSAMRTTSPDRSFDTLRGHPPDIELGERLDVPEELAVPDTGIRIELPPERSLVYASAPLAYYLCADVVPGDEPRLVTDSGFEHPLDTHRGVEGELERVLEQTFLFDCLVRSEGTGERLDGIDALEAELDAELESLFAATPAEQVEAYLSVPYEAVEAHVPTWSVSAHVEPTPDSVELLPYLVNELATIRSPAAEETTTLTAPASGESEDFTRSAAASASPTGAGTGAGPEGPDLGPSIDGDAERQVVIPESSGAHRQVWAASGIPLGAAKPLKAGYEHRLDREPIEDDIEIVVVCNDPSMAEEDSAVRELLSDPPGLNVRIRPYRGLYTHELRAVLERGADFLHFIGHVDDDGLECPDGYLDVHTLDAVGVDAFFLNACDSYEQGRALVNSGAITGVVTLTDVLNSTAVDVGRDVSRLLNSGLPVSNALDVARDAHESGDRYTVIGDGSLQVAQDAGGGPAYARVERTDDGFELDYDVYTTTQWGLGSEYRHGADGSERSLFGGREGIELDGDELLALFAQRNIPVLFEGDLRWSEEITADEL